MISSDGTKLLTTEQVMEMTGFSKYTVSYKTQSGQLHAVRFPGKKRIYYHPEEVAELIQKRVSKIPGAVISSALDSQPRENKPSQASVERPSHPAASTPKLPQYDGKVASAATKLFNANNGIREAVAELEISYELADHLYRYWKSCGPELHLSPKQLATLCKRFDYWESPATVEGLLRAMNEYIEREVDRLARERGVKLDEEKADENKPQPVSTPKASAVKLEERAAPGREEEIPEAERAAIEAAMREAEEDALSEPTPIAAE